MYGYGRGGRGVRGTGLGRGWSGGGVQPPTGYDYVGGCRCGFGPNAYYREASGRVVPASSLFGSSVPTQPAGPVEQLRAEKASLERRIQELEARLQGNS